MILHRAEDLPRMDSGIMATMKKAMLMNRADFIDAYVRVSFVGHTVGQLSKIHNIHLQRCIKAVFTDRVRSTREGYVLTRVCPSICLSTLAVAEPGGGVP